MAVRLLPDDERARRSRAIQAVQAAWTAEQIAAGVDGPTPADRPEPSDYNLHVPHLEASAEAEDDFWARVNKATQ